MISAEAVAKRRAEHEREVRARLRWSIAVVAASLTIVASYLCLLLWVRVMEPFYLVVNLLATTTGIFGGFVVFRAFELPTILADLPRLSEQERRINLAAIEPIRADLLGRALPSLGLSRSRTEAAAIDDDELVRRLAGLQRRDWRATAKACLIGWIVFFVVAVIGIASFRPAHGVSLFDRMRGKTPVIDQRWSPL
jgi:hypothetical protein